MVSGWQERTREGVTASATDRGIAARTERPGTPEAARCDQLLGELAGLIAVGGAPRFLLAPVVPGPAAFPEAWTPDAAGVARVLRRLAWHAGMPAQRIEIHDEGLGAPPTERKPGTRVELMAAREAAIEIVLSFVGEDDVAGTLAHEIGVAYAIRHRAAPEGAYRAPAHAVERVDPDRDLERGSVAAVYLGLGTLAANAALQQYTRGRFNGAYSEHEYDVLRAGYLALPELAFLLAVQAVVREMPAPPRGLNGPQRDETSAWIVALRGERAALCARLGVPVDSAADAVVSGARPVVERFAEEPDAATVAAPARPRRIAFRWQATRAGSGVLVGAIAGGGAMAAAGTTSMLAMGMILAGVVAGHVIGTRVRVARCSACVRVVAVDAARCASCGAQLRGDIRALAERLDAEEALERESGEPAASDPATTPGR